MRFAELPIGLGAIDLIDMHRLRIKTEPTMEGSDLFGQIERLVVVVPTEMIDKRKTLDDAQRQLCAKLGLAARLASFDRTNVRLRDTDNAIIDPL